MTNVVVRREIDRRLYKLPFHVRVPARANADILKNARAWALERMIRTLETQGWTFVRLEPGLPRGPLPVVPVKGFGRRPTKIKRRPGQASGPEPKDDSLWRVSTLPDFGPKAAHLLTDEVEWEYIAAFHRPIVATAYLHEKGDPDPTWLRR